MRRMKAAGVAAMLVGLTVLTVGCDLVEEWADLAEWARDNVFAGQPWWQIALSLVGLQL